MQTLVPHDHYAMSETDTHVYFLGGPYSQWYTSEFQGQLGPDTPLLTFTSAEQYMMAGKAWLFQDLPTLQEIMASHSPREQKKLGRKVLGLEGGEWSPADIAYWSENAKPIVRRGSWYKFEQNRPLRDFMMAHGTKTLVEGADYDPVWGVKLSWDDPAILDEGNWKGTNWLGECLMDARKPLSDVDGKTLMGYQFNPFEWRWENIPNALTAASLNS
jgi:hypothetical protein